MDVELAKENFRKNFFYGMDAKDEVIEYLILQKAIEMEKVDMTKLDTNLYKVEYTLQQINKLVVQLYRFVHLNDPKEKQTYFYNKITPDSAEIEQVVQSKITDLKNKKLISGAIKNLPGSAIYINGRWSGNSGYEYYDNIKQTHKGQWIANEIIPTLEELCILEAKNKQQYYALFLDTKYNRAIHAQEQLKSEQEYLESLPTQEEIQAKIQQIITRRTFLPGPEHGPLKKEQDDLQSLPSPEKRQERIQQIEKIQAALPNQIKQIRNIFTRFMQAVKLPKQDIIAGLGEIPTNEMQQQIEKNSSDYDTISTLKQEATDANYQKRLQQKIQQIKEKYFQEETR